MDFDVEKFIVDIENRPCLWNMKSVDYSNKFLKVKMWEEVVEIFAEPDMSNEEKKTLGISLQKKWRNLRDSFVKECRKLATLKSGSGASHKPSYLYFNQLSFLKDSVMNNKRTDSLDATRDEHITEDDTNEGPFLSEISKQSARKKKKTTTTRDEDSAELVGVLKESLTRRDNKNDPDRQFLLSLLNDFKRVPDHLKSITKMKMLKVIIDASYQPSLSTQASANYNIPVYTTLTSPALSDNSQPSDYYDLFSPRNMDQYNCM